MNYLKNRKKIGAYTLAEAILSLIIVATIAVTTVVVTKPNDIKKDALKKGSVSVLESINVAVKSILADHSPQLSMEKLTNASGTAFTLSSSDRNSYLSGLFQLYIKKRTETASSTYTGVALKNESGTAVGSFNISSFSNGFFMRNRAYIAFKLNENCTTTETDTIYNPAYPDSHTITNSCGLILFDINGQEGPNVVGVDIYIVSIGKYGIQ